MEVCGSTNKTTVNVIDLLQKRAIRVINKVGYYINTNSLTIKSHVMKFDDWVYYKIIHIMYRAKVNLLPICVQTFPITFVIFKKGM